MPRGKILTEFERGQITALKSSGCSLREIASRLDRSVCAIKNYVDNPESYGKNHAGGKPKALSDRDTRTILRLASNNSSSIKKIRALAGVNASFTTVWRAITASDNIIRAKLLVGPKLDSAHKIGCLQWAESRVEERTDLSSVIFSDEKKFNLDGPDGY